MAHQPRRRLLLTLLAIPTFLGLIGCEELGPDARGEISNSAVQRVGVERTCVPVFDVANVRATSGNHTLEFSLRDGTRWVNQIAPVTGDSDSVCTLEREGLVPFFDSEADELCAGELVFIGVRSHQLHRYLGRCRLGGFSRI